ncbi:MAG TPA: ABC transporter permease [Candidatus Acidoferrum sp.]|nr:ABC transporter permease [Candidatus Acidoferrum sp.]
MGDLLQDLRYAVRMLAKAPGFTAIAILTLALGIGANTALFSVINSVLLAPLPFPQSDQLMALFSKRIAFTNASISYPNFLDWQRNNRTFASLACYRPDDFNLTGAGQAEHIIGEMVSADFFSTMGIRPASGRWFTEAEDQRGGAPVAVISAGLWKRKFGSATNIVNGRMTLNGVDYTIVGVTPASFHLRLQNFPSDVEVYVPVAQFSDPTFWNRASGYSTKGIGRLKPGVTIEQARADMDSIAQQLAAAYPEADKDTGITVITLKDSMVAEIRPFLLMLMAAVGFVLLIACVNVANLSLARSMGRTREFAIRSALGAGTKRVLRQLLTESVLLAAAGGALGLLLAVWGKSGAMSLVSDSLPRAQEVSLDWRVLVFTFVISILSGVLFGLVPGIRTTKPDLQEALKEGGRGNSGGKHRAQGLFVAVELSMAVVLLIGAGLMLRSLSRLWESNPGFDPNHVLISEISLPPSAAHADPDAIRAQLREAHRRIAGISGVESVSELRGSLPMGTDSEDPFWIEGHPKPLSENDQNWAIWAEVEPEYLTAMNMTLKEGRFITHQDSPTSPRVAVIDEDFAKKYFPGENPLGKTFTDDYLGSTEIVGVVGHMKQWGLDDNKIAMHAEFFVPFEQIPDKAMGDITRRTTLVMRVKGDPLSYVDKARRELLDMNSETILFGSKTMSNVVYSDSVVAQRFSMTLLGVFAGMALVLASVGIYGVLSYIVGQRTREIGIRIALGARKSDVLRWVMVEGAQMAVVGVVIGVVAAFGLTRLMAGLLYGVSAVDPVTFGGVAGVLMVVALVACYIPAHRAMRVDPIVVLREE